MSDRDQYREAGNQFVRAIGPLVKATHNSSVLTDLGGFSGLYSLHADRFKSPVLVSSTDGVGTKLKIAFMMDKHDTVGIDLVGMVVNDIVVCGARPLFMLDYLAMGKLEIGVAQQLVAGIAEGCRQAHCALLGGETAEMPSMYPPGEYDMAGFAVGVVDKDDIMDGSSTTKGSAVVGLASSGLHSNGYSLVRRIVFEKMGLKIDQQVDDLPRTLGEELLTPTRIYTESVLNIRRDFTLPAAAHITGGGLLENLPRVLPASCRAIIRQGSWPMPPIFPFLQKAAGLTQREMYRTFNSGLGMCLVVPAAQAEEVVDRLDGMGQPAYIVGEIAPREAGQEAVEVV